MGSVPARLPNRRGFDEWYGIPRTTDEAFWPGNPHATAANAPPMHVMEGRKGEDAHDVLEFALHLRRHVGTGLAKILKVGGRKHQHLAAAIVAEIVGALLVFRGFSPVQKISLLALWLLREQIVAKPNRELTVVGELLDDGVILRIVLEAAAGIDGTGDTEAVQLAHEVARGVQLVVEGQLRTLGERGVENTGVRLGQ